jgi:tRNA threonylcarbamoyladenosine biosynthesis protein TsaE
MPSKKSKALRVAASPPAGWERACSEEELPSLAAEIVARLGRSTWIFLEGDLGAGKSTLAQYLLRELGHARGGEGSPTFPLAHEYRLPSGLRVAHLDLYRLRSEAELEMTGLFEHFSGEPGLVLVEWASRFPEAFARLREAASSLGVRVLDVAIEWASPGATEPEGARRFRIATSTGSAPHDNLSRRRS